MTALNDAVEATKPFSAVPGPRPLPFLGDMSVNMHRIPAYHDECFKKYGEIFKLKLLSES